MNFSWENTRAGMLYAGLVDDLLRAIDPLDSRLEAALTEAERTEEIGPLRRVVYEVAMATAKSRRGGKRPVPDPAYTEFSVGLYSVQRLLEDEKHVPNSVIANARSKLVNLGFAVVNTRTGEYLSEVFHRRDPARAAVRKMLTEQPAAPIGVHTLQAHVPADWERGDSLEGYAEPRDLAHLGIAVTLTPNEDLTWREVYARAYQAAEAQGLEEWRARQEASRVAWADYEARTGPLGQAANDSLHRRISEALGWSESGTRAMSLASLRDLVRPVDPALAEEIGNRIRSGSHIARPGGAQRSQAELWRQMFGRDPPSQRPNGSGYYVWALARGSNEPLAEGPWGPYDTLESAKTFARIGATEGAHDRAVSLGLDPESAGFHIVRRYESGTGERLL